MSYSSSDTGQHLFKALIEHIQDLVKAHLPCDMLATALCLPGRFIASIGWINPFLGAYCEC